MFQCFYVFGIKRLVVYEISDLRMCFYDFEVCFPFRIKHANLLLMKYCCELVFMARNVYYRSYNFGFIFTFAVLRNIQGSTLLKILVRFSLCFLQLKRTKLLILLLESVSDTSSLGFYCIVCILY